MQTSKNDYSEEWVKILGKGMITIPKVFRQALGLREGNVAKIRRVGKKLIIEPKYNFPFRIYTNKEIQEFLKEDKLPPELAKKAADFWEDLE